MRLRGNDKMVDIQRTALVLALLLAASCSQQGGSPAKQEGHEHEEKGSANFEPGKGILLSKESLASVGVKTAEVEEREIRPGFSAKAQVFRGADERSSSDGRYRQGCAYAAAAVPVSRRDLLEKGLNAAVKKEAASSEERSARIVRVDDSLQAATRSIEVLLEIPDEASALPIGAFVEAAFSAESASPVIAVPVSALLRASEGNFVYVQNGRHLLRTAVKTGASDGSWIEIADGLMSGDVVAIAAVEALWTIELRAVKGGGGCH